MIVLNDSIDYKLLLSKEFKVKFSTDQNFVGRLVYKKLGTNYGKIDSTMIGTIIENIYKSYSSFYEARKTNSRAQLPKYLFKDDKFTLNYAISKCSLNEYDKTIRAHTSSYVSKNLSILDNNYVNIATNKYIHKKHLKLIVPKYSKNKKCINIKPNKKNSYFYNVFYVNKNNEHIVDSKHIFIPYIDKLHSKELKTIEIVFENGRIKYCINYINVKSDKTIKKVYIDSIDTISIDLGVKNLMTIFDPNGEQYIIPGNCLVSTNFHYSKLIAYAQSTKNSIKRHEYENKRLNIINDYFNKIVKWMENKYSHKKMIIVGYNKQWKNNTNLGKKNNMTFNKIPFCSLIKKLCDKFINKGIIVKTNEESYTSKCDALSNEKISRHDIYMGKRLKRGLFSSAQGKLINADINGAINIMRKIYKQLVYDNVNVCNPIRINIFHEVFVPVNKSRIVSRSIN